MKKLLSLFGAILLFGLASANAITVNFNFSTSNNAAPGNYIAVYNVMDSYSEVPIPSNNQLTFNYGGDVNDENLILSIGPKIGIQCEINISIKAGFNTLTPEIFNTLEGESSIKEEDGFWDIFLENNNGLDNYTFEIIITTEDTGNEDDDSKTFILTYYSNDYTWDVVDYYNYVTATITTPSNSTSDLIVNKSYDNSIEYVEGSLLTFTPLANYEITEITFNGNPLPSENDYELVSPNNSSDPWKLTLKEGFPDFGEVYVAVSPVSEGSDTPTLPGGDKSVTLNVLNGDPSKVYGFVSINSVSDYLKFENKTATYEYSNNITFTFYSTDENYTNLNVECIESSLENGKDYDLNFDDDLWTITLGSDSPDNITFNISFDGIPNNLKYATLNIVNGDADDLTAYAILSEDPSGFESITFKNNTVTYQYTDFLQFTLIPNTSVQVIVEDGNELENGKDYSLDEDEGNWYIDLDSNSPEEITFNIVFPKVEVNNPTITLNFTGKGLVEGLTVEYSDYYESDNDATYHPDSNPFKFDGTADNPSEFTVSAEGYDIVITLSEAYAEYADLVSITRNNVMVNPLTVDNLTFDVNIVEGKPGGIDSIQLDENAVIYNIQGLRINDANNLPKGLYIINGKKVIVK